MKNYDLEYISNAIGSLSGIPIRLYKAGILIYYYSLVDLPKDPIIFAADELSKINSNVGYYVTPDFHYYGIINYKSYKIILGPTCQLAASDQKLKELAFHCDVPHDETDDFISAMKSIIHMPLESIMQILCVFNYIINGEKLQLNDITIYDSEQEKLRLWLEKERVDQNLKSMNDDVASQFSFHNTLAIEQTIMNIVRKGDTAALREWIKSAPAVRPGIVAADQIRQSKNMFIVTATLVARAAIRGGMDIEDSLSLSDSYIQKCELLNNLFVITNLQYRMVLDFTERVEKLCLGKTPTKLMLDVANYIQHHLSETITTENIAKALYVSRTHLSKKFKDETGQTLTDFILKEKTEEAKRLLRYSNKSLASISDYLGFSSQSHFSRVFKKYTEWSPNDYREKHMK